MYIVNTSFFAGYPVHEKWLEFLKGEYIPYLQEEGYRVRLFRVVSEQAQPEGFTYCLMADCPDMEHYSKLTGELFERYKAVAVPLFGQAVQWFTTLLKETENVTS